MAGDTDVFLSSPTEVRDDLRTPGLISHAIPEGEAASDLVAFAKGLADAGVVFYGAAWCPSCTEQKEPFQDGGDFLPFVEVTKSDRTLNAVGIAAGIDVYPTWEFPDGSRLIGVQTLETLSLRSGVAIPQSAFPSFTSIGDQVVAIGSPLHVPVNAYNPAGGPISVTVSVADPDLLEAVVLTGNRSIRMNLSGYGDMVFELFEDKAPRPSSRIIELAGDNFYDSTIFHRIIDNFVIQGGDPTGTGSGGSTLGSFDDQFHPDLQHNRSGVLSYAKAGDDTNDSQFFITEGSFRTLDYNHSVFGQLVEGERVREAISEIGDFADKGTNGADKPLIDIVLESISVFDDTENSVVMFKAKGTQSGTTTVTITATNSSGETFTEVIAVSVVADSGTGSNSAPYLADIATPATRPNTSAATLQLSSLDVEGDAVEYFVSTSNPNVVATVDATTGLVTVTPNVGFVGTASVVVGIQPAPGVTGALTGQSDTQSVAFTFSASPGQNTVDRFDVDNSGVVEPLDALLVLVRLSNAQRDGIVGPLLADSLVDDSPFLFVDVDGNGRIEPLDALLVLVEVARRFHGGLPEGELAVTLTRPCDSEPIDSVLASEHSVKVAVFDSPRQKSLSANPRRTGDSVSEQVVDQALDDLATTDFSFH